MKKINVQTHSIEKDVIKSTIIPISNLDTFMSCVSYWIHGSTVFRKSVRKRLILFFTKECFKCEFVSVNQIANAYFQNKSKGEKNRVVETIDEAMRFVFKNSIPGIISSLRIMIMVVSDCLNICVTSNNKWQNPKIVKENVMHLRYDFENKLCKLLIVKGLCKIKRKTMYRLFVSKVENELAHVCDFERTAQIHKCCIKERKRNWIYTVTPINEYKHVSKVFVYLQKCGSDTAYA